MQVDIIQQLTDELAQAYARADFGVLAPELAYRSFSFCDPKFGDFASNIALQQAKILGKSPRDIAQTLADQFEISSVVDRAEVAGPGFLNIYLHADVWGTFLKSMNEHYYLSDSGQGQRVNIEFISANPTGPLVLVNAWNGFYGDVLARLYASQGYEVTREYYLNDGGNQIAQLGRAVQQAAGKTFAEEVSAELYRGSYIDALAERFTEQYGSQDTVRSMDPSELGDSAQKIIFAEYIQPTLTKLGIVFDEVYPESILDNRATVERLAGVGAVIHKEGAVWLDAEKAGLEQDEVLVRSTDKQDTYFLKDISYQYGKLVDRKYDRAITIVGPDHHGQEKRLLAALKLLGLESFVPLWTQTVRLIKDGAEFKMSKRRGTYILLDELLEMVPVETARFFFAMRDTNSHFDLDLDIIAAQNKHNPLYYVMYAYVRMQSVLSKAEAQAVPLDVQGDCVYRVREGDRALVRKVVELRQIIASSVVSHQVHPVFHALIDFANLFHDWYERHPILKADENDRTQRLLLIAQLRRVLQGTFELIGITPIDRME